MRSFDKQFLMLATKNLLRFWKGRGFKEVHLSQTVSENTYSEFFLGAIKQQLTRPGDRTAKDFMNTLFNILNDLTTELFVIFKLLKNRYDNQALKKTRLNFQLAVDLFRVLELLTRWVPEIFLDKQYIHSTRLLAYLMFVLRSIFFGKIDSYIEFYSSKINFNSETLAQFLAPLISILKNLYDAVNDFSTRPTCA
jgi:hypothetical protein